MCTVPTAALKSKPVRFPAIMRPKVPSSRLAKIIGDHAMPRSSMVKKISDYAKRKGLQDESNLQLLHLDSALQSIMGVSTCSFLEISKHLTPHIRNVEDVGGKYVKEAKKFEEEWMAKKRAEMANSIIDSNLSEEEIRERRQLKQKKEKKGVYAPVVLSDELSAICQGKKEMTRQDVIRAIWRYIKMNNLNSVRAGGIRTDFLLKKIFNADKFEVTDVMKAVSRHTTKKP